MFELNVKNAISFLVSEKNHIGKIFLMVLIYIHFVRVISFSPFSQLTEQQ